MTWATMVGVDSGRQQAMTWVKIWGMMWAMMRATGTMAAMMPATTPAEGMVETPAGRGGRVLVEDLAAAVAAAAVAAAATTAAAYCRGHLLFIVKIFCVVFL
jgi:hypothetical protein